MKEILLPESDNPTIIEAARIVQNDIPILLRHYDLDEAMGLVSSGYYSGMVVGIEHSTADVLRSAFKCVPLDESAKYVSSFFIMENEYERLIFADCAVNPSPTTEMLVDIAVQTAKSARMIGLEPRVAMLSFSTHGSAQERFVGNVAQASRLLKNMNPDFAFDGEVQFDAAYSKMVAAKKMDASPFKEEAANVFIFPDLNSGNIAYKITQYLGHYDATGPILQGFQYPINDLSRGASVEDVVRVIELTHMQIQQKSDSTS